MAGKTTNKPITSQDQGPSEVKSQRPDTVKEAKAPSKAQQEQLDRAPNLDQREYIVDGNTEIETRPVEQGTPVTQEAIDKDHAEARAAAGAVPPLDDRVVGNVEPGASDPSVAQHTPGLMDVPAAEGDEDSIRAWNARKEAEKRFGKKQKYG